MQHSELELGKSTSFLAAFLRGTPPCGRAPEELSSVMTLSTKMAAPVKRFIFFVTTGQWHDTITKTNWTYCKEANSSLILFLDFFVDIRVLQAISKWRWPPVREKNAPSSRLCVPLLFQSAVFGVFQDQREEGSPCERESPLSFRQPSGLRPINGFGGWRVSVL